MMHRILIVMLVGVLIVLVAWDLSTRAAAPVTRIDSRNFRWVNCPSCEHMKTPVMAIGQGAYFITFNNVVGRNGLCSVEIESDPSRKLLRWDRPQWRVLDAPDWRQWFFPRCFSGVAGLSGPPGEFDLKEMLL